MEPHLPVVSTDGGPWADHDVACPVCWARKAVLQLDIAVFHPCDWCTREGWCLHKTDLRPWWKKLLGLKAGR